MIVPAAPYKVCLALDTAGFSAFVVGGAVRDTLIGLEPKDWDIATNATPNDVCRVFKDYRVLPTGIKYGTVTVLVPKDGKLFGGGVEQAALPDGEIYNVGSEGDTECEHIEVTTFRADGDYSDGRRPDAVTFSKTIEEDLARRDFTCNAIAFSPTLGLFVDPYDGRGDIEQEVLRAVGNPVDRFNEDGLRIMRAVRIAAQKEFLIDVDVREAIKECVLMLNSVSKERIRDELLKTLDADVHMVRTMMDLHILHVICPALTMQRGMLQNRHHAFDCWEHTLKCVEACEHENPVVKLAVLLHDIAKPVTRHPHPKKPGDFQFLRHESIGADMAEGWMREYKFSNDEIELVTHCVKHHLIYYTSEWTDKQMRKWYRTVGPKHFEELLYLRRCDIMGKGWDTGDLLKQHGEIAARALSPAIQATPQKPSDLAINGRDVMSILGITKGNAQVGEIMRKLMDEVTDNPETNTPDQLRQLVKEYNTNE